MENNVNGLKVGDRIMVEQAWEDETGNYDHDEIAEIVSIAESGELKLTFPNAPEQVQEFLNGTDSYMANDFKKYHRYHYL